MCRAGAPWSYSRNCPDKAGVAGWSVGRADALFGCRRVGWSPGWSPGEGVTLWFEALVEELDVPVEVGHLPTKVGVRLVVCGGCQGGSFGFEPGPAEHRSQLCGGLLVGFDLEGMASLIRRCAGVDGPSLSLLMAPVPGEVLDGLVDVVGDGVNMGGV